MSAARQCPPARSAPSARRGPCRHRRPRKPTSPPPKRPNPQNAPLPPLLLRCSRSGRSPIQSSYVKGLHVHRWKDQAQPPRYTIFPRSPSRKRTFRLQPNSGVCPKPDRCGNGCLIMRILLIGSGGREHALALKLASSPLCERLFIAPGNPGTAQCGMNLAVDVADHAAVAAAARAERIDLVVVGLETPLVAGLVDDLAAASVRAFGPSRAAAELEGSKAFTKELCAEAGIPTARFRRFTDAAAATAYVRAEGAPIVVKADGLAAGKGVVVAASVAEAERAIADMLGGALGQAGAELVIEECLVGEEASLFALCDGTT